MATLVVKNPLRGRQHLPGTPAFLSLSIPIYQKMLNAFSTLSSGSERLLVLAACFVFYQPLIPNTTPKCLKLSPCILHLVLVTSAIS